MIFEIKTLMKAEESNAKEKQIVKKCRQGHDDWLKFNFLGFNRLQKNIGRSLFFDFFVQRFS